MERENKMFDFVGPRNNPLGGKCPYDCYQRCGKPGCWAQRQSTGRRFPKLTKKYSGDPSIYWRELDRNYPNAANVFYGSMRDMWSDDVPDEMLQEILAEIAKKSTPAFFCTKNPKRYWNMRLYLPKTAILGCTIETDQYPMWILKDKTGSWKQEISKAPTTWDRLEWMRQIRISMIRWSKEVEPHLKNNVLPQEGNEALFMAPRQLVISIEPILKFDKRFLPYLLEIKPDIVAVGYDNYGCNLPEPTLQETEQLIADLKKAGIDVRRKKIRKAWNEP